MNLSKKISDKIRHIQFEPESVKVRYIWILAIAIFIVIVAVWLVFLKINTPSAGSGANSPILDVKNELKEKIKSNFGNLKNNALPELKEILKDGEKSNEIQVSPSPSSAVEENLK